MIIEIQHGIKIHTEGSEILNWLNGVKEVTFCVNDDKSEVTLIKNDAIIRKWKVFNGHAGGCIDSYVR